MKLRDEIQEKKDMKVIQTKIYEESKVILKLGEDFKRYHLHNFYSEEILV